MLGYALFLVPMVLAFWLIARRQGARQALLDLIAFNLFFAFDFTAITPGQTNVQLLHLLLLLYLGYEAACLLQQGRLTLRLRLLLVLVAAALLIGWVGLASVENRLGEWGAIRVINYVTRIYLLSALFLFVGAALVRAGRLRRFLLIFCFAGMLVGAISLIQSASLGRWLAGDTDPRYLGVFQPVGDAAFQARLQYFAATDFINQVRKITVGGVTVYRAIGTFNGAPAALVVGALVALCLLTARDPMPRWLPLAFALMVGGVAAAFIRTMLATFILLAIGVLALRFRSVLTSRRSVVWLLPMLFVGLLFSLLLPPVQTALAVTYDGFFGAKAGRELASLNGRTALWSLVLAEIGRHPLFGTNRPIIGLEISWGDNSNPEFGLSTHNSFLEVAYNAGIFPALLLAGLFLFALLRAASLTASRRFSRSQRSLFLALLMALAALTIVNQTGDWMNTGQIAALFWILCGFLAAYPRAPLSQQAAVSPSPAQPALAGVNRP